MFELCGSKHFEIGLSCRRSACPGFGKLFSFAELKPMSLWRIEAWHHLSHFPVADSCTTFTGYLGELIEMIIFEAMTTFAGLFGLEHQL